ncbi:hypothetical protein M422DRAFT_125192, partial [Sphaerobolus stellatus SS14]
PLPSPLASKLSNPITLHTIHQYPDLFKIVTPINMTHLHKLLLLHPNQLFVELVCQGFHKGFWSL